MRIKKYRILRRGRAHPARSPAENAILRKGRRRDISHPLPCGRIFRHRQHQHRLCPARCVPGKGRRAAVGVDDLLDDVQTQNVGRILPRFTGLQGVQHGGRVARAVVGYRDPQCFSCAHRGKLHLHGAV